MRSSGSVPAWRTRPILADIVAVVLGLNLPARRRSVLLYACNRDRRMPKLRVDRGYRPAKPSLPLLHLFRPQELAYN